VHGSFARVQRQAPSAKYASYYNEARTHVSIGKAVRVGLLINPSAPTTEPVTRDVMTAAAAVQLQIEVVEASNSREIEAAFATIVRNKVDALLVVEKRFSQVPGPVVGAGLPGLRSLRWSCRFGASPS
jgi:hypothetical protein